MHFERLKQISVLPGCPSGRNLSSSLFFLGMGSEMQQAPSLGAGRARSWDPAVPQLPQGRAGLKEAVTRSEVRAARKSWLVISIE